MIVNTNKVDYLKLDLFNTTEFKEYYKSAIHIYCGFLIGLQS